MVTAIEQWRSTYRSLGKFARIKAKKLFMMVPLPSDAQTATTKLVSCDRT